VAKLPRLMKQGPPQFVDPKRLAATRDVISGTFNVADMPRVKDLLSRTTGCLEFELTFDKDHRNRVLVTGHYRCPTLIMQCQRCLQVIEIEVESKVKVTLLTDEDEAVQLAKDVEPLIVSGKELSLVDFFEDELILALPLAPRHETDKCYNREKEVIEEGSETQRPFAILKNLKFKHSTD
jgi:uncharacterized protein